MLRPKVEIIFRGGLIQMVNCSVDMDIKIIDYDNEPNLTDDDIYNMEPTCPDTIGKIRW